MSLLSLKTKNFQSHSDVTFRFVPGINLIIGSSGNGKTVVRRALTWMKNNRPTGNRYVSFWDRDNKKSPKTEHSVSISLDDEHYSSIIRIKAPDFNGYEIWNDESNDCGAPLRSFEAIGTDVPEEVTSILNLSEVNIHQQWDQPFLLSESPGKVAEFFNKIIKLDLIDEVLSKAESMRRQNNRDIEDNKKLQEEIFEEINKLLWVEKAAEQITQIDNEQITRIQKQDVCSRISTLVNQFHQYEDELEAIPENLDEPLKLMDSIDNLEIKINQQQDKIDKISELLEKYDKYCDELEEIDKLNFREAEKLMNEISELENKIIKKEQALVKAEQVLDKYREMLSLKQDLEYIKDSRKTLEDSIPEDLICPTCQQPVDKRILL